MMEAWLEPFAYMAIIYVLVDRFFRGLKWVIEAKIWLNERKTR
jgi:hypothetical protein